MLVLRKSVVFYDGKCNFCRYIAIVLIKLDYYQNFKLIDLWAESSLQKKLTLTKKELTREINVVSRNGEILRGHLAVRNISQNIPILIPVSWLFYLPFADFFSKKIYKIISDNRYRLLGCKGDCSILETQT